MALSKLVLSDFGILTASNESAEGSWGNENPLDEHETAFARMVVNLDALRAQGCITAEGMPFNKISGFQKSENDTASVRNPADIFPEKELRLLFWGSPHPNPSCNDGMFHGSKAELQYKVDRTIPCTEL